MARLAFALASLVLPWMIQAMGGGESAEADEFVGGSTSGEQFFQSDRNLQGQKFNCDTTKDSKGNNLKVKIGPTLNQDWCKKVPTTTTTEQIMDACEAFCGKGNIPVIVGIASYGFNQADADKICLAVNSTFMNYEADLMLNCKLWSKAMYLIDTRVADFIAAVDNMTYSQLQFRAGIAANVKKLVEAIGSPRTEEIMNSADDDQLLTKYVEVLRANMQDFFDNGPLQRDLKATMETLRDAGSALNLALNTQLPKLKDFISKCGSTMLATTAQDEYLLDICNVRTNNCIQKSAARHASCCCGAVPLAGSFSIKSAASRRLSGAAAPAPAAAQDETMNVCAEATARASGDVNRRATALTGTTDGDKLLDDHNKALRAQYPDYYARCSSGGRRLDEGSSELQQDSAQQPEPVGTPEEAAKPTTRKLSLVGCNPTPSTRVTSAGYKAAFWKDTETDYCDKLDNPVEGKTVMDVEGLSQTCQAFCGNKAVPLLLGSTTFGFNQSAMDSVCQEGIVKTDPAAVTKCHDHATAFKQVQTKTAALTTATEVLRYQKLVFEASVKSTIKSMKTAIKDKAESVLQAAGVDEKITKYQELLQQELSGLTGSQGARLSVNTAIANVEAKGLDLQTSLNAALDSLNKLVTDCNKLYTGRGPNKEYLLDVCFQTSTACMDKVGGRHVGCCCGYSPQLALGGGTVGAITIPGIEPKSLNSDDGKARVASRRLQSAPAPAPTPSTVYDICAESWQNSQTEVNAAKKKMDDLDQSSTYTDEDARLAAKYPAYYSCNARGGAGTPGGGAGGSGGAGGANTSPAPPQVHLSVLGMAAVLLKALF